LVCSVFTSWGIPPLKISCFFVFVYQTRPPVDWLKYPTFNFPIGKINRAFGYFSFAPPPPSIYAI